MLSKRVKYTVTINDWKYREQQALPHPGTLLVLVVTEFLLLYSIHVKRVSVWMHVHWWCKPSQISKNVVVSLSLALSVHEDSCAQIFVCSWSFEWFFVSSLRLVESTVRQQTDCMFISCNCSGACYMSFAYTHVVCEPNAGIFENFPAFVSLHHRLAHEYILGDPRTPVRYKSEVLVWFDNPVAALCGRVCKKRFVFAGWLLLHGTIHAVRQRIRIFNYLTVVGLRFS